MHVPGIRAPQTGFARRLFAGLPARYDRLAAVLSLGQDGRWRREMVDHVAHADPGSVIDVATGPAGVALQLATRTNAWVTGIDLSTDMLGQGRRNVRGASLDDRITFVLGKGEQLPFADGSFDAMTFTYLLRYVEAPAATLVELARVVRPGGVIANLEFAVPPNAFWRWMWRLYTRAVLPVAGAALGGRPWYDVGRFLGPNIEDHYRRFPIADHLDAWTAAGIEDIGIRTMSLGGGVVMWGRKRPSDRDPRPTGSPP
jgi:demethylmenaquinone methyltransferase/2-methoxy-6-polyprenyl-1,4-benzoquinol methylase